MTPTPPAPDAVLHLAALHTLAAAGFASTSSAASVTLSTALSKYLKLVAGACVERATLAGRSKVAAVDVVDALDGLGVRVGELAEWAEDEPGVSLGNDGLGGLEQYLQDGLSVDEGVAHMRLVPEEEYESESDDDRDGDQPMDQDDDADGAVKLEHNEDGTEDAAVKLAPREPSPHRRPWYRHQSPDMSWLPPLPGQSAPATTDVQRAERPLPESSAAEDPMPEVQAQSIADRYRRPVPYASSQLSQAHPFHDPPKSAIPNLPPAPSSLPHLISAYAAIASEPSIAARQTNQRLQAQELLRHSISTVDSFNPAPTLTSPIPPVRASPIVPVHCEEQPVPPRFIRVNPNRNGLLTSLLDQTQSTYLPATLKERLVSLRPPVPQLRDDKPIFYGDPVRGPDDAALVKARGKHVEDAMQEVYLRHTWDSGPRGMEKWSRGALPRGKKVVQSKEGELAPREEEGARKRVREDPAPVKLRLPSFGPVSPGEVSGQTLPAPQAQQHQATSTSNSSAPAPPSRSPSLSLTLPPPATPSGTGAVSPGIRLKLGPKLVPQSDPEVPYGQL
ncbi:hypothetical protein IAU60_001301 [Kwoniella sp. DSM 27419]